MLYFFHLLDFSNHFLKINPDNFLTFEFKYSLKVANSISGPFALYPKFNTDLSDKPLKTEPMSLGLFTSTMCK